MNTLQATEITAGMKFTFTPTGNIFTINNVTQNYIIWRVNPHRGGRGENILRTTRLTFRQFQDGLNRGIYKENK